MSKARSPRALLSMTIGTSIGLLRCDGGGRGWGGRHGARDERVDDLAVTKRHAQVGATAARGEIFAKARLVSVARQLFRDLRVDLLVGGVDPLLLSDRRE